MILESLEIDPDVLARRTGWQLKPVGACKGSVCVPMPRDVDARLLAERLGMPLLEDRDHGLWVLGPETLTGRALSTPQAPELVLPDFGGRDFALSSLRGQKVVLLSWASWCGCRFHLPAWQALRDELHPAGLELVTVALDFDVDSARPFVEAARLSGPALIDRAHVVDELLGIVNVPSSVWIDEQGMIVRPPEPAHITKSPARLVRDGAFDGSHLEPAARNAVATLDYDHEQYLEAIHDWVRNGAASEWALDQSAVIERAAHRGDAQARAAAHFELGTYLHQHGEPQAAAEHWQEAHRLHPSNWTYKRQVWQLAGTPMRWVPEFYELGGTREFYPAMKR